MNNLGRALYMAAFAFMFIVAATTAIYLYGTLNFYLNNTTETLGLTERAESAITDNTVSNVRDIDRAEIYITLFNMSQMHVKTVKLHVKSEDYIVSPSDVEAYNVSNRTGGKMPVIMDFLSKNPNAIFTYSVSDNNVVYTLR